MALIFSPSAERELRGLYSASSRTVRNEITELLAGLDDAPEYAFSEADALPVALDDPTDRPHDAGTTNRSIVRADGGIVWILWRDRGEDDIEIVGAVRPEATHYGNDDERR